MAAIIAFLPGVVFELNLDYILSMQFSSQIKPISYVKAHATEILAQLESSREPIIITQNGEAKAILQDLQSYEQTQETLALLKILALGQREVEQGKTRSLDDVVARLRSKVR